VSEQTRRGRRLSEERTEHILGLSTIYRRWPTKQDLVRASLCCDRAAQNYAVTGDARADVKAFLMRLAEDLSGDGAQTLLGFLASLRSDPEVADGPAILIHTAAVSGQPIDAEAMATRLTELMVTPRAT